MSLLFGFDKLYRQILAAAKPFVPRDEARRQESLRRLLARSVIDWQFNMERLLFV
jgi:hypothetical protein